MKVMEKYPIGSAVLLLPLWIATYAVLQQAADALVLTTGLPQGERLTEAVRFFVYEVPKVLLLLTLVVFVVGIVRSYFSPERTRAILGGKSLFVGNISCEYTGYCDSLLFLFCGSTLHWIC